jgi:hypothetical protein
MGGAFAMRDRFTIGLVIVGLAILSYAIFSPRSGNHADDKQDPSIKLETNPDAILPDVLRKLDEQIRVIDGLIMVVAEPGLDTFLLPISSPWLIRCGTGASISLGSFASGSEGSVGSEVDVSLSYNLIDKNACATIGPRIAARLQEKLAGR